MLQESIFNRMVRCRCVMCAKILALSVLLAQCLAGPGRADDEFFKGKTITFIVPTAPGGGYDTYSRLIARHIGRFLPGQPNVVTQNMPGAAGIRAANYLYNVAPKDGTVIAMPDQAVHLDHILGTAGLNADPARFNWIGRLLSNSAVLYAWHTARVKKIEDVFSHELIVSTSGTASRLNWTVLNNVVGTKFKIITGYKGTTDSRLAMLRGEVEALEPALGGAQAGRRTTAEGEADQSAAADRHPEECRSAGRAAHGRSCEERG